jgi:hypothetical protein
MFTNFNADGSQMFSSRSDTPDSVSLHLFGEKSLLHKETNFYKANDVISASISLNINRNKSIPYRNCNSGFFFLCYVPVCCDVPFLGN